MKIYLLTEEQLRKAIDLLLFDKTKKDITETFTPIELPSDEEIEENAKDYAKIINNKNGTAAFDYTKGAKWMKEKILNQKK